MAIHTIELFAGVGQLGEGLRAGLGHLGLETRAVCYVEREAYAASVLAARMQEGSLDAAPIWSDVTTLDARRWRGAVDCIVGGFPCQDLSLAGRRAGLDGKRSGLFFEICRIADDCGARFLFLENVAGIASATATVVDEAEGELDERAASRVLGELADRGWNAEWVTLSAASVGASHGRERWFCWAWRMENAHQHGTPEQPQEQRGHEPGGSAQRRTGDGCHAGAALDNTTGPRCDGTGQRPASDSGGGQCLPGQGCAALGHTRLQHQHIQQREDGAELSRAGQQLADAECACDRTQKQTAHCGWDAQAERPADQHGRHSGAPVFAPGPADPAWAGIIQQRPHLAPALEPSFHRVVDGLAHRMDDCRPQRLKCCGNGVVALQAAAAVVQLVRRAKGVTA